MCALIYLLYERLIRARFKRTPITTFSLLSETPLFSKLLSEISIQARRRSIPSEIPIQARRFKHSDPSTPIYKCRSTLSVSVGLFEGYH
nr:hypothetical protein CFP56_36519 [Quercus suber]